MFHEKIREGYSQYAFWEAVPLFEFFCLARILPYMTLHREKDCIIKGLARIYSDLYSLGWSPTSPTFGLDSGSPQSDPESLEYKVTVIVPALGAAMDKVYASGAPKLLALNVSDSVLQQKMLTCAEQRLPDNCQQHSQSQSLPGFPHHCRCPQSPGHQAMWFTRRLSALLRLPREGKTGKARIRLCRSTIRRRLRNRRPGHSEMQRQRTHLHQRRRRKFQRG
jgi:hypothetical protein